MFRYDDNNEIRYLRKHGVTVENITVGGSEFIHHQDVSYIIYNIRDFSINGLYFGVVACAEEEVGKVVCIGHNLYSDDIYVGIELVK